MIDRKKIILGLMTKGIIKLFFTCYNLFLFVRIFGSWFPKFRQTAIMKFVSYYTDPYLNIFRKVLPPLGGMLDFSPVLAFFALQFLETITLRFFS